MTAVGLSDRYRHPRELERRNEGAWFTASLQDGTTVRVLVLSDELAGMVQDASLFLATMERAARIRHDVLDVPLAWGQLANGDLHVAFRDADSVPLVAGAMSAVEVATAGEQVARALAAVHATGLVDGSLRRTRLRQRTDGTFVVREFGLLPALIAAGADSRAAALVLTEASYVSPEVLNGSIPDERSDIYSLGAVLYELLTGKPPYGGRTTAYVMASVLAEEPTGASDASAAAETTNPVVDALVRAIEREPEDRWPSSNAFSDALAFGRLPATPTAATIRGKRGCLSTASALVLLLAAAASVIR